MADPIDFNRDFQPRYGEAEQLSPLIRRVVAKNPSPFTYKGTCTYIVGRGNVAVIDPGPADQEQLEAILRATEGETVSHIVVTHTHLDHSPGTAALKQRTGATVHASGLRIPQPPVAAGTGLDASVDRAFACDVAVPHGGLVEGDGWTLEGVFTPGHLDDHMGFALREDAALFSGDHVMAWSTSVIAPPDGNMSDYMASLRLLLERDDAVYWPGHGGPVTKPRKHVQAFITHRKMREAAILRQIEAGNGRIPDIVARIYEGLAPGLERAAQLSVLAHVEDLVRRGAVEAEDAGGLAGVYRTA